MGEGSVGQREPKAPVASASSAPSKAEAKADAKPEARSLSITISQAAVDAIGAQIAKRNVPDTSLRVGIRGGGCSGFSYVIEFYDGAPHARDVIYDLKTTTGADVRVLVDKKSLLYLNGATLEWEKTLLKQGFKFVNPNETASCGCGTSFNV